MAVGQDPRDRRKICMFFSVEYQQRRKKYCLSFAIMDTKTENFIRHLELNFLVSNVFDIEKWGESILTDLINYYGSQSQFEGDLRFILNDYKNSNRLASDAYYIKQINQRAEFKIKELLKRILYAERNKPDVKPVKPETEKTTNIPKQIKSEPVTTINIHDNHPEKRIYNFTLNQILGILTFFVGFIGGAYLLGKDNGAKYSERDFQKKDDVISAWQDTVKTRDLRIAYLMKNSDSAAQIVPTLRYDTLPLRANHKQIIQHYMESLYEVLLLNKK